MSPIGCFDHSFHSGRYVDGIKAMVKDNSAVSIAPSIWYISLLAHNPLSPFLQVQRTSCHPPPCLLSNDLCDPHEHTIRTASHAQHTQSNTRRCTELEEFATFQISPFQPQRSTQTAHVVCGDQSMPSRLRPESLITDCTSCT